MYEPSAPRLQSESVLLKYKIHITEPEEKMLKNQAVSRKNHRVRKPFRTWRRERARPAERSAEARTDFGRCCDERLLSCRNGVRESTYIILSMVQPSVELKRSNMEKLKSADF